MLAPQAEEFIDQLSIEATLKEEIKTYGQYTEIDKGIEILKEGQYVKVIPLVVRGVLKVHSRYASKELLLYYIKPQESCVMSFAAGLNYGKSKISAWTEEQTGMILLPIDKVNEWVSKYPSINRLFYDQYSKRYEDLLNSLNHLMFDSLEDKVLTYLREKIEVLKKGSLKITHAQIAKDLGSSREVITRVLKKLEHQNLIQQSTEGIRLIV